MQTTNQQDEPDAPTVSPGIEVIGAEAREAAFKTLSADKTSATYFRLRQRLVKRGRAATCLAATDTMRVAIKVFAASGERTIHAHPHEDHTFIVLQGTVRFYDEHGKSIVLEKHQGALIPRGVPYKFFIEGAEPAVMLRVGASLNGAEDKATRRDRGDQKGTTNSRENKKKEVVFDDGYFQ